MRATAPGYRNVPVWPGPPEEHTPTPAQAEPKPHGPSVNHVTLVGRLTADPEMVDTRAGKKANLRVATNGGEAPEFHQVSFWGSRAQTAGEYLQKGRLIYLEGRLHSSSWQDATGAKHRSYEILGDTFQFLDSPGKSAPDSPRFPGGPQGTPRKAA
jgi:single-strand DNA-binding protein